ncbi:hypothetical protein FDECE_5814 [Fusarium decemcellulare]|nr:hypothetical protein FDECE_5814 [Fusarium decemcellulare]
MGSIYRDAAAVIFAAASRGSNGGILNDRPLELGPEPVKLKIFNGAANAATATLSYFQPDTDETLDRLLNSCPLVSRGWTLQEASLSSRSITYGIRGIYWQCPQQFRGANGTWEGGAENFPQRRAQLNSVLHHRCDSFESPLDCRKLFDEYYDLVEDYSRRKLTNPSDKLPAISAITAAMSVALGQGSLTATYLAGLWDIDLPRGLMWQPVDGACRAKDYRSPSWSWAAIDGRIEFPAHTELMWQAESWHLKMLDYSVDLQNRTNRFGEINSCRIVVECLTIPLVRSSQKAHRPELSVGSCAYDFPLDGDTEVGEPEEVFEVVKNERTYLMTFKNMVVSEDDESAVEQTIDVELGSQIGHKILVICIGSQGLERNQAGGLIVSKRSGSNDYERVGFLRWFLMDFTSLEPEMETLTLV